MLLTLSTTYFPASDIGFLFHKHPARVQDFEISGGKAHVFYPEVSDRRCTIALLLDIDPVGLVRREGSGPAGNEFALGQYVNDRPYVASSLMSAAIAKAFSSAINGRCKDKPELADVSMPWEITLAVLPVRGGESLLRHLFEPLGYTIGLEQHALSEQHPEWGLSRYFTVRLQINAVLKQVLTHLYVLIPVCDNDKHYWIGREEVEKLMEKGREWLPGHPAKELIAMRYLKHQRSLAGTALEMLVEEPEEAVAKEPDIRPHALRLEAVKTVLLSKGVRTVADLGCGEGKLLQLLMTETSFEQILGMDVSHRSLQTARSRLKVDLLPARQQQRIELIQGSLTYRDKRIEGYEAAALIEVIEHLDETRLAALEKVVFQFAHPRVVVITTPNAEYNVKFTGVPAGGMRHSDHRFEWTRAQLAAWGDRIAARYGYGVLYEPLGEADAEVGALSQMAVFTLVNPAG